MTDDMLEVPANRVIDLTSFNFNEIPLGPTELAMDAILIVKTQAMTDHGSVTRLVMRGTDDMDFITFRGMLELAHDKALADSPLMDEEEGEGEDA